MVGRRMTGVCKINKKPRITARGVTITNYRVVPHANS